MHDVITHFANQDCVLFCVGTKLRQSQLFECGIAFMELNYVL